MKLLNSLGLEGNQHVAASRRDADIALAAGAGCGKTRTLVGRYLALLDEGISPRAAVAITFTDRAAREMRNRIRSGVQNWLQGECPPSERERWRSIEADIDTARIGTIHGLCAAILRAHPAEALVDPHFRVLDEGKSALLRVQAVEDALAWANSQLGLVPLFDAFETQTLAHVLSTLLDKRLDVPTPQDSDTLLGNWDRAVTEKIASWANSKQVCSAIEDLHQLDASGTLERDAGPKLADQVRGLLGTWEVFVRENLHGKGLASAVSLFQIRRRYCLGTTGKKDSRAKEAIAQIRDLYDSAVNPWLGGKGAHDQAPDRSAEDATCQLVPLLLELFQQAVRSFQAAKDLEQALDFDDLESGAVRLLSDASVLPRWQRQLSTLLVDEFQDTNARQQRLVRFLAGLDEGKRGRLFIVGDAKQSIYRFRGADVTVFRSLQNEIADIGGLPLVLDVTYRAHAALVDSLNEILGHIMGTEDDPARAYRVPFSQLQASHGKPQIPVSAPFVEFLYGIGDDADAAKQSAAHLLAARLRELNSSEKVRWDQIALLFRAATGFPEYEQALEASGVPFVTVAGRGFYDRPEIRDLLNLLRALSDPWDDLAMAGLLRSPAFGLTDAALYQLRWSREPTPVSFETALTGDLSYLRDTDRHMAERARDIVKSLRGMVDRVSVAELLKQTLDATHYVAVLGAATYGTRLQRNVDKLLSDAQACGIVRVDEFLEYIDALKDAGAREGEAPSEASGAVRLMSVHKAKGLEFPVVVIADAARGLRPSNDAVFLTPELGLVPRPDRLERQAIICQIAKTMEKDLAEAEDVRLLYVAATRARDKLIICGHKRRQSSANWLTRLAEAAQIDLDFLETQRSKWHEARLACGASVRALADEIRPVAKFAAETPGAEMPSSKTVAALFAPLAGGYLEETDLKHDSWEDLKRQARRVTGLRRRPEGTVVGTLVHAALQSWLFPDNDELDDLLRTVSLDAGIVQSDERQATMAEARGLLARFSAEPRWHEINMSTHHHEVPYSIMVGSRVVSGFIDLLYMDSRGIWQIVEFKTDTVETDLILHKLIESHSPQVRRYREAAFRSLGRMPGASLCFLDAPSGVYWHSVD